MKQTWGPMWVAAGAALWATDSLLRRPLTASLSSVQIVLTEHLILTLVLLPVSRRWWPEWRRLGLLQWAAVVGIAWGGSAAGTVLFTEAIRIGNPTTAVLLQKIQPVFAALLARALLRERLGSRFWVCLLLALGAGYLVSFGDELDPFASPGSLAPAMLALGAAAVWGSSTVLGRFALRELSFPSLTALRVFGATLALAALTWAQSRPLVLELEFSQARSLLLMALVPGLAALLVYYYGLRQTRASIAAIAELSFPATATVLNWLFLDARVTLVQVGGFLILWAVILQLERRAK